MTMLGFKGEDVTIAKDDKELRRRNFEISYLTN